MTCINAIPQDDRHIKSAHSLSFIRNSERIARSCGRRSVSALNVRSYYDRYREHYNRNFFTF